MAFQRLQFRPSTNIQDVLWEAESKTLQVVFWRQDRTYNFYAVPVDVADGFETSGLSAGKWFNLRVAGQFSYDEIT